MESNQIEIRHTKPGDKPLGRPTKLLKEFAKVYDTHEAKVPCNGCTACCRSRSTMADLQPDELTLFPEAVMDSEVGWVLPQRPDGSCVHLIDDRCSIYERRPLACRIFDCRMAALLQVMSSDPVMVEATQQWKQPELDKKKDRVALMALKLAGLQAMKFSDAYWEIISMAYANYQNFINQARDLLAKFERIPPHQLTELMNRMNRFVANRDDADDDQTEDKTDA